MRCYRTEISTARRLWHPECGPSTGHTGFMVTAQDLRVRADYEIL
jgi:hypothetical protein